MDVASPLSVCRVGRTTFDAERFAKFTTTAHTIFTLATRVTDAWHGRASLRRDSHHPSVPGQGHRSP